jgi:putative YhbY family RNA-binding protein
MTPIDSLQRRALRARAHRLHPIVAVGNHGLTPAVLHEIDVALTAHELIKVRVFSDLRAEREALLERICAELSCAAVQHLGKVLIIWRPNPEPRETPARKHSAERPTSRRAAGRTATGAEARAAKPGGGTHRAPTGVPRAPGGARKRRPVDARHSDNSRRRRRATQH